jgi:prepilin-type N-terminal cleavage/methylation domain-containing protein
MIMIATLRLFAMRRRVSDKRRQQQGFTLIELSIVLTIIGLIVGGILKGQELINNARIKAQVAQIDNIKSAVFTFQDRYNYLPGDYPTPVNLGWASGTSLGDGNGFIGTLTTTGGTGSSAAVLTDAHTTANTEAVAVWPELAQANLMGGYLNSGGAATSITSLGAVSADGFLPAKMASGVEVWLATFSITPPAGTGNTAVTTTSLAIRLDGSTDGSAAPSIKRPDMISLDSKYDDGLPGVGSIVVGSQSTADCAASATAYATTTGVSAPSCNPFFIVQ